MNKKIIALLVAIIIVAAIAGIIFALYNNQENTNNISDENLNNSNVETGASNNLVLINGGTFQMGSPETEMQRESDETHHDVTVSDFYIGKYEVTQSEYEKIMGVNPSNFKGENVSWDRSANGYRLPTEAEWEYAARAGTRRYFKLVKK